MQLRHFFIYIGAWRIIKILGVPRKQQISHSAETLLIFDSSLSGVRDDSILLLSSMCASESVSLCHSESPRCRDGEESFPRATPAFHFYTVIPNSARQ